MRNAKTRPRRLPPNAHLVGVRFPARLLEQVDALATVEFMCPRSQAVRRLVREGLKSFRNGEARC